MSSGNLDFIEDDQRNEKVYEELYSKHGNTLQTLNWGSRESQLLRFKILNEIGDLAGTSVLDVGCGFGDFYQYLIDGGTSVNYTGIDITRPIILAAKEKFPHLNFMQDSILELKDDVVFDYVFASGIYTYRSSNEYEFLETMTRSMFAHCTKGVAFNCLSEWAEAKDEGEFYADPLKTLAFCKALTPWVSLRHDYHSRDFTIYLYKNRNT